MNVTISEDQDRGQIAAAIVEADERFVTRDGETLAASVFYPAKPNGASLLVNSGTAIPRQFYRAIARFLAYRGFGVVTYDYRNTYGSANAAPGSIELWGREDQAAMLGHVKDTFPNAPIGVLGHSLGGQILGLADNIHTVRAAVLVASQSGYWRYWQGAAKLRMWALWYLLIPGLTLFMDRFPGSWLGSADLPRNIARSWAAWGRSPHYICDDSGKPLRPFNHRIAFPIRWLSFSDDPVAPYPAVEALRSYYPAARITRQHLTPQDMNASAIGHFGFFKAGVERKAWEDLARWFELALIR